jgi:hypothetical protein
MKLSRIFRSPAAIVAAAAIISGSVFAFAANNAVDQSAAGAGTQDISGYKVQNITYKFTDDTLDNMEFTLIPSTPSAYNQATQAQVQVYENQGYQEASFVSTPTGGNPEFASVWKYQPTPAVKATQITKLSIVAASGPATPEP